MGQGPDYVLHAIIDFIVDGYLPVVETIEERVLTMEQSALDAEVKRIFRLRQELIRFKRIIGPMTEVCGRLVHLDTPCGIPASRQESDDGRLAPGVGEGFDRLPICRKEEIVAAQEP